jgi:hypothetical protein
MRVTNFTAVIRAGRAELLPWCSRLALPIYKLSGATHYTAEETAYLVRLQQLPSYLADMLSEVRLTGKLGSSKGFDHLWEELIRLLKGAIRGHGGEAAKRKLEVYSHNIRELMQACEKVRDMLHASSSTAAAPISPAPAPLRPPVATVPPPRKISALAARTEASIRKCTALLLGSGVLEKMPAPGAPDYRPNWLVEHDSNKEQAIFVRGLRSVVENQVADLLKVDDAPQRQ